MKYLDAVYILEIMLEVNFKVAILTTDMCKSNEFFSFTFLEKWPKKPARGLHASSKDKKRAL